jgi:hypothetical protein
MKWYSTYQNNEKWQFIIRRDSRTKFHTLYVYENYPDGFNYDITDEFCRNHNRDYEQDDLEMAKRCAFNQFGVPYDSWQEAPAPKPNHNIERK